MAISHVLLFFEVYTCIKKLTLGRQKVDTRKAMFDNLETLAACKLYSCSKPDCLQGSVIASNLVHLGLTNAKPKHESVMARNRGTLPVQ